MSKKSSSSSARNGVRDRDTKRDRWKDIDPPTEEERNLVLLEKLLTQGNSSLDLEVLKSIKSFCKASDSNLQMVFDAAVLQLAKPHAQIRLATLQLFDELFARSHMFRQLTVGNYTAIMNLALGINGEKLPAPENWARKVKTLGLILLKEWNDKFGPGYRQLEIGFNQIRALLKLESFPDRAALAQLEFDGSREKQEAEERKRAKRRKEYEEALLAVEEAAPVMKETLQTLKSCIGILVPADPLFANQIPDEEAVKDSAEAAQQTTKEFARANGLGSGRYTLDIDLSDINETREIREDEDNSVVFDELRVAAKQAGKHLKKIAGWLSVVQRADVDDKRAQERVVKSLMDRSTAIRTFVERAKALIEAAGHGDDDEEETFEEVAEAPDPSSKQKGSMSDRAARAPSLAIRAASDAVDVDKLASPISLREDESDQVFQDDEGPKKQFVARDPKHAELLQNAPFVEYDNDLDVWDTTKKTFEGTGLNRAHRFLGEQQEEHYLSQDTLDRMRKRVVSLKPKDEQIHRACGAPLPKGGLCQRRDMAVCPLHGPIVPRDEMGNPLDGTQADEQDEEAWKALEDDVIKNLGLPDHRQKRRRGNRDEEPSKLVDLKKAKDTVQNRLKKKLDNPTARRNIRAAYAQEEDYIYRDRNAFSWR